jgi:hypothetical protein
MKNETAMTRVPESQSNIEFSVRKQSLSAVRVSLTVAN